MSDLLFELGCEEIPAKMLAKQLADLPALVEGKLAAARIAHAGVRVLGTPRRLAVLVASVADRQPDLDEEVVGPPVSAAFAADGTLTKAGQGFAAKNGVAVDAIAKQEVAGKKGLYAVARRHVVGGETRALLPGLLAELCGAMAWPKSQRWGWSETTFVRPVQWLVALFGGEVVPFTWAGTISGRKTRGHRFHSTGWLELADGTNYVEALRAAHVLVDPAERRARVVAELARLATETGLRVRPDDTLVGEVMHLGEWPVGLVGSFDPSFLEVPEEITVTAMRNHQRYFAFEDASGKLANKFATMMATAVDDTTLVRAGNEKVIVSRLSDGKFFFAEDRKSSFAAWNQKLDGTVFQKKLGDRANTIGAKVRRIEAIVTALAPDDTAAIEAARVCKADLASKAVGEFPELQGVMGRHYAKHFGASPAVAVAIDEHWWPKGQGGALPTTPAGALVSLADKMDTIVGCFAVGLEPSGSADPLALRRAAIGIWQILLANPIVKFATLFGATRDALAAQGVILADATRLDEFFRQRLRGIFGDAGIPAQDADAALAQDFRDPIDARARALACAKISKEAREVFKRVANILDDARGKKLEIANACDPRLFVAQPTVEQALYDAVFAAQERERQPRADRNYTAVFESLEQLRPTVAMFFDKGGVMVMDPDPKLRDNRLALLHWFISPYLAIADFRVLGGAA